MARLYGGAGKRSSSYPLAGDELLMTVSAGKVNGQWTLLEHLGDGSTRSVSVFEAGQLGDIWVGGAGGKWSRPWGSPSYGHGFMAGGPGTTIYTLAPDKFDKWGAGLDVVGIAGDASGHLAGKIASQVADVVSLYRSAWGLAQTVRGGASSSDIALAVADLAVDIAGFQYSIGPDVLSLLLNFGTSVQVDEVR